MTAPPRVPQTPTKKEPPVPVNSGTGHTQTITLPPYTTIFFSSFSNASFVQHITLDIGGKAIAVFKGCGENVPMKHTSGGKNNEVLSLPSSNEIRQCKATFEYIKGAGTPAHPSKLSPAVSVGEDSASHIRSLSINSSEAEPKGDHDCDSQLKVDMVYLRNRNPVSIRIPKDTTAQISCMANAVRKQHVLWWMDNGLRGVFTGSGENKAMMMEIHGKQKTSYTLDQATVDRTLYAAFSYFGALGDKTHVQAKKVTEPLIVGDEGEGNSLFITVGSEDGLNNDNNDSVLRVVAMNKSLSDSE